MAWEEFCTQKSLIRAPLSSEPDAKIEETYKYQVPGTRNRNLGKSVLACDCTLKRGGRGETEKEVRYEADATQAWGGRGSATCVNSKGTLHASKAARRESKAQQAAMVGGLRGLDDAKRDRRRRKKTCISL